MDNVSRRVEEEASSAFVCVAGSAESMNVHLTWRPTAAQEYHSTPKRASVEMEHAHGANGLKRKGIRAINELRHLSS